MNGNATLGSVNVRGGSVAHSDNSEESEQSRPNTRGKKRTASGPAVATNGRRKAEEAPPKAPASKKAKTNGAPSSIASDEQFDDDDDMGDTIDGKPKHKMTEDEKRKNFLERNR